LGISIFVVFEMIYAVNCFRHNDKWVILIIYRFGTLDLFSSKTITIIRYMIILSTINIMYSHLNGKIKRLLNENKNIGHVIIFY